MMSLTGYEVVGPAGFGAAGTAWNVRDSRGNPRVAIRTVASAERLAALQALRHRHLPAVHSVHRSSDGGVMVMELVPGHRLGVVLTAREWATHGEVAGLWAGLADALAALHHRKIVHGDISPANILIADDARPVLIDIAGHGGAERGHEGFIPPGAESGPSEAGDVWSLARTLLWASGGDPVVRAALGSALADDPGQRPSARELALSWQVLGRPSELVTPPASRLADASMRACDDETWLADEAASSRWWRPVAVAASIGVVLGIASVIAGTVDGDAVDYTAVIAGLVDGRDRAVEALDAGKLTEVFVDGARGLDGDRQLIARLSSGGYEVDGYETVIHSITVADDAEDRVVAELEIAPGAYDRIYPDGTRERVDAGDQRCVRIVVADERIEELAACG